MRKRDMLRTARLKGAEHGHNAMFWYSVPKTATEAQLILDGIDAEDMLIMEALPHPELHDPTEDASYASVDLLEDLGLDARTPFRERRYRKTFPEVCDIYEQAFNDAVILDIWKICRNLIEKAALLEVAYPKEHWYSCDEFPGVGVKIHAYLNDKMVFIRIGTTKQVFPMNAERLTQVNDSEVNQETGQIGEDGW